MMYQEPEFIYRTAQRRVRFKMGASFRLPLSNCTGCGRDARDPSEAPHIWRTPAADGDELRAADIKEPR